VPLDLLGRERLLAVVLAVQLAAASLTAAVGLPTGSAATPPTAPAEATAVQEASRDDVLASRALTARTAWVLAAQPADALPSDPPPTAPPAGPTAAAVAPPTSPAPARSSSAPAPAAPATAEPAPADTTADTRADYERRLVAAVNAERRSRALPALTGDGCGERHAAAQAERMAASGRLAHQDLGAVLAACGTSAAAENVGQGPVSPERMVALWMASDSHRAAILDPGLTAVGTGAVADGAGRWWVAQVFLTR
jgi:uncharacterized protein YkwD